MIEQTFASKRPVKVYQPPTSAVPWYSPKELQQATARGITPAEFKRRSDIVADLFRECKYYAGETLYPSKLEDFEKYGACLVTGISSTYTDFSYDSKWPKNDNPMIVSFVPSNNDKLTMLCTTNYLVENPPAVTC